MSVKYPKRLSKQWIEWNEVYSVQFRRAAYYYERTALNTVLGLKLPLNPCIVFLAPQSLEAHFEPNVSQNILKCVCRPRVVSNASQTKWQIPTTSKRPRIIQPVFLSKHWLLIALDTVFRRKWDWGLREWILCTNLPETHFKVKSHHSIFQSTPFNRELRRMRSTTNIFPEPHKISIKLFHSETAKNPTGLVLMPEFPRIPP